jgi:hypothetical protein
LPQGHTVLTADRQGPRRTLPPAAAAVALLLGLESADQQLSGIENLIMDNVKIKGIIQK